MRLFSTAILTLAISCCAFGQTYTINTFAGNGTFGYSGDNGPATSAQLNQPWGVAVDAAGNVYIADTVNNRIRKVANGVISTVAGNGTLGYSGDDGPATSAQLSWPAGVAVDSAGNLYVADQNNFRIRKVSNGVITTVAGNGMPGYSGDNGPATSAKLYGPVGVAVDSAGNLYIADQPNNRIRKVSNGVITTVAGNGPDLYGNGGYSGDNGPATSARLNWPEGVAVDFAGNLFIADYRNNRIRKVSNGVITTAIYWDYPQGVGVDAAGNLFIADNYGRISKLSNGVITTVAGTGTQGFSGDNGPATGAQLSSPVGVAVEAAGNVYVADFGNNRIRVLVPFQFIAAVTNAASNLPGSISPGEIVVLYGSGIGPAQLVKAAPGSDGSYGMQLANASMSFNGIPAPMIYAWASQTAAIVPYGITGAFAQVTVTYQDRTSQAFPVSMASSAPGIYTYDSSGKGPAAAINQDGVTVNTAATPTKIGDIISLYATGEGQTTPAGVDGKAASVPYPYPNLPVTATVGGQDAPVKYAGGAPGLVAGLMQVNIHIPSGIQTGNAVPVVLRVGDAFSPGGVTIAVR
jgi:uncharacterized protein (TIGR03437 family)